MNLSADARAVTKSFIFNATNHIALHHLRRLRPPIALLAFFLVLFCLNASNAFAQSSSTYETVVAFDATKRETPESIVSDYRGNLYASLTFSGEIRKITSDGTQSTLATLPVGSGNLNGLAVDRQQNVYAALSSGDAATHGVWRIARDGSSARLAALPPETGPNGMTFDRAGNLYVSDSRQGGIWRIARDSSEAKLWLQSELLTPLPGSQFPIGANGLKFWRGDLFLSSTDRAQFVRVKVNDDGSAGTPSVYLTGLRCDDFLIDPRGNFYVATGFGNEVVRVDKELNREVLLTGTNGIDSPSAIAFAGFANGNLALYVSNLGFLGGKPGIGKLQLAKPQRGDD